jgi:hypothetical protein
MTMKISLLAIVCAVLAVGPADQVSAASLNGGYTVSSTACSIGSTPLSGQGAGELTEMSSGCGLLTSGNFISSGSGAASYQRLQATAYVEVVNFNPDHLIGVGGLLGRAIGIAEYIDNLVIDIPGREGDIVDLVFTAAMNGLVSASVMDPALTTAQASASLVVTVGNSFDQGKVSLSQGAQSNGDLVSNDFNPGSVQIKLGDPFGVDAKLQLDTQLRAMTNRSTDVYYGDALAEFGNSAGITSFELYETGGGALIPDSDWNLMSESGAFGFYTVVPLPAGGWLFGSGLLGLIGMAKRKKAA